MSEVKINGSIIRIFETQQVSDKFKKREFVIRTEGTYPQDIIMQFTGDRCDWLNGFNLGESVEVFYNLRGREYNGKFYNTIEAWRINKANEIGF